MLIYCWKVSSWFSSPCEDSRPHTVMSSALFCTKDAQIEDFWLTSLPFVYGPLARGLKDVVILQEPRDACRKALGGVILQHRQARTTPYKLLVEKRLQ